MLLRASRISKLLSGKLGSSKHFQNLSNFQGCRTFSVLPGSAIASLQAPSTTISTKTVGQDMSITPRIEYASDTLDVPQMPTDNITHFPPVDTPLPTYWTFLIFILLFCFGGITGVTLASPAIDQQLHDTMYVVGHFHYTFSIAAMMGSIIAALIYMEPYINSFVHGPLTSHAPHTAPILIAFLALVPLTFLHYMTVGQSPLPRRIYHYADYNSALAYLSSVSNAGSLLLLLPLVVFA